MDAVKRQAFNRTSPERNRENLSKISILSTVDEIRNGAGCPSVAYYLKRKQAILIIAKSDMPGR
jgi:hypothetical protein